MTNEEIEILRINQYYRFFLYGSKKAVRGILLSKDEIFPGYSLYMGEKAIKIKRGRKTQALIISKRIQKIEKIEKH